MAESKRYYWLKLHEEFFAQPVMKYLRKLPDGEKITIIYLKLLLVSLRTDGYILLEGLFPTMEEEIALNLDEELMAVQFSIAALEKVNLLERGSGEWDLCMTRLPEMVGSESGSASKMRRMRERQQLVQKPVSALPAGSHCDRDVIEGDLRVTSCDAEKERNSIYERFNLQHPEDFRGHSLSVSDVIVVHKDGQDQAWYVDSFGFQQVPEFFTDNPLKKVEELLEDDYGMIDGIINNGDRRKDQEEKKPSVMERLQDKKKEAAEAEAARPKAPVKDKAQGHDLS